MKLTIKKLDFLLIYLTPSLVAVGVIQKIITGVVDMIHELPAPEGNQFTFGLLFLHDHHKIDF